MVNNNASQEKGYLDPHSLTPYTMMSLKYDIRMPQFHRLAIIMAQRRDLYKPESGTTTKGPEGITGKKCPKCKGIRYAKCSESECGFALSLACHYSEHIDRVYARHLSPLSGHTTY